MNNWSVEKHVKSMSCILEPTIDSCDTGQWIALFNSCNMDVRYQILCLKTQTAYTLDTWLVMPGHYEEIFASQPNY